MKTSWWFFTNPSEQYESNWIIFPGRDKKKQDLKPPTRQPLLSRITFGRPEILSLIFEGGVRLGGTG